MDGSKISKLAAGSISMPLHMIRELDQLQGSFCP